MKKFSLLLLLMVVSLSAMAGLYEGHSIWLRTFQGGAVNPATHTTCIQQDTTLFEVLVTDGGGMVYIKNIVFGSEQEFGDYWVQGYIVDDEIHIPINQYLIQLDRNGSFIKSGRSAVLTWGTVNYNAFTQQATFYQSTSVSEVVYKMDGNTIHIENTSGPVVIEAQDDVSYEATGPAIAWEVDGEVVEWAGYLEWNTEIDINPHVIYGWPEGELKTYNRTCDRISYTDGPTKSSLVVTGIESDEGTGYIVFGYDGKTVYMRDPIMALPYGTWIVGSLSDDGNSIKFILPQILFDDSSTGITTIEIGTIEKGLQPSGWTYDKTIINCLYDYHYVTFNIRGNTISMDNTWAEFIDPAIENIYAQGLHSYDYWTNKGFIEANIVYTLESDDPVEPTERTDSPSASKVNYVEHDGDSYYNAYTVTLTPAETEPDCTIWYRIGIMEEGVYVFGAWTEYVAPFNVDQPGSYRIEAYAITEGKLESYPIADEFVVSRLTDVEELMAGKTVASVRYYNMAGQEMRQPDGMTIIVTTYNDGTTTATKVMK